MPPTSRRSATPHKMPAAQAEATAPHPAAAEPRGVPPVAVAMADRARIEATDLVPSPRDDDDDEPTGVVGTLREMPVIEIVQSLAQNNKDALVEVKPRGGTSGIIAVAKGRVLYARVRELVGEAAFFELFCATRGTFRIRYGRSLSDVAGAPAPNIDAELTFLIFEGARLLDERASGRDSPVLETPPGGFTVDDPFQPYEATSAPVAEQPLTPSGLFSRFFDEAGVAEPETPELPREATSRFQSLQIDGLDELVDDDATPDETKTTRERKVPPPPPVNG